jgi:hypothetical protein
MENVYCDEYSKQTESLNIFAIHIDEQEREREVSSYRPNGTVTGWSNR